MIRGKKTWSQFALILNDVQVLVSSFPSFCVVHVKRSANQAAHACAQFASVSDFETWANDATSFLFPALQADSMTRWMNEEAVFFKKKEKHD